MQASASASDMVRNNLLQIDRLGNQENRRLAGILPAALSVFIKDDIKYISDLYFI